MIHIKDTISINAEQARFILEKETSRMGICIDLDRVLDYQSYFIEKFKPMLKPWRELGANPYLEPTKRNDVISVLVKRFGISEHKLMDRNSISIKAAIVNQLLEDPTIDEEAIEFLKLYKSLRHVQHRISYLEQYANCPLLVQESFEGSRMVLAQPRWEVLSTSRISASEPSVQNLLKEFGDIITAPPGFTMVFADSGQIEPRVTYSKYIKDPLLKRLIEVYNDAYFGQLRFILMSQEEEDQARQNLEGVEKTELPATLRKELKVLGLAGTYGGGLEGHDPVLAAGYREKIVNHPQRKRWEAEVTEAVRHGQETFYAAFGTPITPEDTTKYSKGSPGWVNHLIRCGINNPIQGTASELMCESVYRASNIISTKAKGPTAIGYYKHDEGFFYVHDKDKDLIDELAGCLSYQVEGWIPIYSDLLMGKKPGMEEATKA